jgi:ATP-dependent Clp protease ATP-binding subunit ClpC
MMRFDRFTERAQDAAQRAAEIIQRYGHNQIDTEHILLALIEQPQGVITQILEKLNIDIEELSTRLTRSCAAVRRQISTAVVPGRYSSRHV